MSEPAVQLGLLKHAAQGTVPVVGVDDFVACVPVLEAAVVGELVLAPSLVKAAAAGRAPALTPVASGRVHSRPSEIGGRARWTVGWGPITAAEAELVIAQLREMGTAGNGGADGFVLRPDGAASAVTVSVRPVGPVTVRHVGGVGTRAVFEVGPVECEELIQ